MISALVLQLSGESVNSLTKIRLFVSVLAWPVLMGALQHPTPINYHTIKPLQFTVDMFQVFCHLLSNESKIHLHKGKSKACDTNSVDHVRDCCATTWDSSGMSDAESFLKRANTGRI